MDYDISLKIIDPCIGVIFGDCWKLVLINRDPGILRLSDGDSTKHRDIPLRAIWAIKALCVERGIYDKP